MTEMATGNAKTTIAVFQISKFAQLGYSARIHPDGYVYFTKDENCAGTSDAVNCSVDQTPVDKIGTIDDGNIDCSSVTSENEKCSPSQTTERSSPPSIDINSSEEPDVECAAENQCPSPESNNKFSSVLLLEPELYKCEKDESEVTEAVEDASFENIPSPVNDDHCQEIAKESNTQSTEKTTVTAETNNTNKKLRLPWRFVHHTYVARWRNEILRKGYASCMTNKCNFISTDEVLMKVHFKYCDGLAKKEFICYKCQKEVDSFKSLTEHIVLCRGEIAYYYGNVKLKKGRTETDLMNCRNPQCNFVTTNSTDMVLHQGMCQETPHFDGKACDICKQELTSAMEQLNHQMTCGKVADPPAPEMQEVRLTEKEQNQGIVQPGPVFPVNEYHRRRGYTKQHKKAWMGALEKQNYVQCIFQNCYFLAMSLEDMIFHFGFCNGDSSYASFICPYCQGRVTSQEILDTHIMRSHSGATAPAGSSKEGDVSPDRYKKSSIQGSKNLVRIRCIRTMISDEDTRRVLKEERRGGGEETEPDVLASFYQYTEGDGERERDVPDDVHPVKEKHRDSLDCDINLTTSLLKSPTPEKKVKQMFRTYKRKRLMPVELCETVHDNVHNVPGEDGSGQTPVFDANNGVMNVESNYLQNAEQNRVSEIEGEVEGSVNYYYDELQNTTVPALCNLVEEEGGVESEHEGSEHNVDEEEVEKETLRRKSVRQRKVTKGSRSSRRTPRNDETDLKSKRVIKNGRRWDPSPVDLLPEIPPKSRKKLRSLFSIDVKEVVPYESGKKSWKRKKLDSVAEIIELVSTGNLGRLDGNISHELVTMKGNASGKKMKMEDLPLSSFLQVKLECEDEPESVKCGKCGFVCGVRDFQDHNSRKHFGLSWIDGDDPPDIYDERSILPSVKQAFRLLRYATCEACHCVKKSVMGFITHIQVCGKTSEEREALKATCGICGSKVLKYSMPSHMKILHPGTVERTEEPEYGKRRAALKAVSKLHQVIRDNDDFQEPKVIIVEKKDVKKYTFFERGVTQVPTLPNKILGLWYKMARTGKSIPCRRNGCFAEHETVPAAKTHHFNCPEMPAKFFSCRTCDFNSEREKEMKEHVEEHPVKEKAYQWESNEEDGENAMMNHTMVVEEEEEDEYEEEEIKREDGGEVVKLVKKTMSSLRTVHPQNVMLDDPHFELNLRKNFNLRENLTVTRGHRIFRQALGLTFEDELRGEAESRPWLSSFVSSRADWSPAGDEAAAEHLPSAVESIAMHERLARGTTSSDTTEGLRWRTFKRFEGDLVEGTPTMFTGGSVRSASWCPVTPRRCHLPADRQYLAVSASPCLGRFQDVKECRAEPGLLQIWDCGPLHCAAAEDPPRMALGLAHNCGEVWDLAWLPVDTRDPPDPSADPPKDSAPLPRLGVLAAACQDGTARIWSVCRPDSLHVGTGPPIFKSQPVATLILDEESRDGCLQVTWSRSGLVLAGFASGIIALWSLRNVESPFCRRVGRSRIMKPCLSFQAHKTIITAVSFCPFDPRFACTGALDRTIKFWDLEAPSCPLDSYTRGVCLASVWPRLWPLTLNSFEDVLSPLSVSGAVKSFRDFFSKPYSTMHLDYQCWSLSFSDWLNAVCGCNSAGEVKLRVLKNLLLPDEKTRQDMVLSTVELHRLDDTGPKESSISTKPVKSKGTKTPRQPDVRDVKGVKPQRAEGSFPRSYDEARANFGLLITDYSEAPQVKRDAGERRSAVCPEEFPIASVNKVCFNPNLSSFSHLAVCYSCGIVRVQRLGMLESDFDLKEAMRLSEAASEVS